jgi:hypothetical protein
MESVVIDDFDIACVLVFPSETYSKLVVDSDAVLASSIAFQCFKAVAGRELQFAE